MASHLTKLLHCISHSMQFDIFLKKNVHATIINHESGLLGRFGLEHISVRERTMQSQFKY